MLGMVRVISLNGANNQKQATTLEQKKAQEKTEPPMNFDSSPWNNPSPAKKVLPDKLEGILVF